MCCRLPGLLVLAILAAGAADAQNVLTLDASQDNTIFSDNQSSSNGAGDYLFAGQTNRGATRRALLAFDIAGSLPAGATVESVELVLTVSKTVAGDTPVTLHRVSAEWGEGASNANGQEGGGAAAQNGDATWSFARSPSAAWTPGGAFAAQASATATVGDVGAYTFTSAGLVADVQAWLDGTTPNYGWIVRGDESAARTAKRFNSRENASGVPHLRVTVSTSTAAGDREGAPALHLATAVPNPFGESTAVAYTLPHAGHATLRIYNTLGQAVATLAEGWRAGGDHTATFDARALPAGLYLCRLEHGGAQETRVLTRLR